MKKILLIFSKKEESERKNNIVNSIRKYLGQDTEIEVVSGYEDLQAFSTDKEGLHMSISGNNLSNYDLIYLYKVGPKNHGLSNLIALYCENRNIKFINSREKFYYHSGKILQKIVLTLNLLPNPRFYFSNNLSNINFNKISIILGSSFILKKSMSSLGKEVFLITNEADLSLKLNGIMNNEENSGLWFFEEFIPHQNTYRGFVTGNKCNTMIKVEKELESFKTNHGKAYFTREVIPEVAELATNSARLLKLQVAGVDIVFDDKEKKYKILEANKSPGITIRENLESLEAEDIANYIKFIINERK